METLEDIFKRAEAVDQEKQKTSELFNTLATIVESQKVIAEKLEGVVDEGRGELVSTATSTFQVKLLTAGGQNLNASSGIMVFGKKY